MDEYLSKPIQVEQLVQVMEQLTRAPGERPTATTAASRPDIFDPRPLMQRISEDRQLFEELVGMFQGDYPRMLEQVRQAIESADGAALEQAAHLLKGSVSNFTTGEAVRIAQRLEKLGREGNYPEARDAYGELEQALAVLRTALDEWLTVHPA